MTLKETIFEKLKKAQKNQEYISGENLAQECNVSRSAIWKAIKSLENDGIEINAVTNKGYILIANNQYNQKTIQENLLKINADKNIKILFYDKIDSTNTQAKRLLLNKNPQELNKTVCVANEQTAGKGRLGRHFYSPSKTGIYFSIIYSPKNLLEPTKITTQAAVGICRAIKKVYEVDCKIKWVNDIYLNEQKVCGILTEGTTNLENGILDAAIIGIGINIITNSDIPNEIKKTAGSIIHDSSNLKRSELLANAISETLKILDGTKSVKEKAMQEYKERSNLIGKEITVTPVINVKEGKYKCLVKGISDDAKLIVQLKDGSEKFLDSGEVSLHN